jgi:hypothetical protein
MTRNTSWKILVVSCMFMTSSISYCYSDVDPWNAHDYADLTPATAWTHLLKLTGILSTTMHLPIALVLPGSKCYYNKLFMCLEWLVDVRSLKSCDQVACLTETASIIHWFSSSQQFLSMWQWPKHSKVYEFLTVVCCDRHNMTITLNIKHFNFFYTRFRNWICIVMHDCWETNWI